MTNSNNESYLASDIPVVSADGGKDHLRRDTTDRHRPGIASVALAVSLVLIAFSLRSPITSVGPILVEAVRTTGLTALGASTLTTLPSLCFGLFGPLAPAFSRRLGSERALFILMLVLTFGILLRGVPTWQMLFFGQIVACFSIGLINVLLPGIIKRDFPGHIVRVTGFYSAAMSAGAALAAAATVPTANAIGHIFGNVRTTAWAWALALWALPAALAALIWLRHLPTAESAISKRPSIVRLLLRDPLAWHVTAFMGTQSSLAYIVFGWLATVLRMRGLSAVDAGLTLSLSVIAQVVAALLLPILVARLPDQRAVNVIAMVVACVSLIGCFFGPLSTIWGWAALLGVAQGAARMLALTAIGLRAPDSHVAAQLSSMAQGIGYTIASAGPFIAGSLLRATGSLYSLAALCAAICMLSAWFGYAAGQHRQVRLRVEQA